MTVLDLSSEAYHQDDTGDVPTLNATIANILCTKTPAHAKAAHPRLNPDYERKQEEKFELGTAVHSFLLQGVDIVHLVNADDWRTKDAKAERELARQHGRVPMLIKQWDEARRMVEAVREQCDAWPTNPKPLTDGEPEKTLVWDEDGVRCRARLDWLSADRLLIEDLKTTGASADPQAWQKTLYNMGADVQAVFYARGVQAVFGTTFTDHRWIVAECAPPYAVSVVDLSPSAIALAQDKVDFAVATWKRCLAEDRWPGYAPRVASVSPPAYVESAWFERQAALEEAAA